MKSAITLALLALSTHLACATYQHNDCIPTLQKACGYKFAELVNKYPSLVQLLSSSDEHYTVFCPSDHAFKNANIPSHISIEDLLKYHIIPSSSIKAKKLPHYSPLTTAFDGKKLTAVSKWYKIQVRADLSKAYIIKADTQYYKGLIHKIDTVLIPDCPKPPVHSPPVGCPSVWDVICRTDDLKTLKYLVEKAGLVSYLQSVSLTVTIFAPINRAWVQLYIDLKIKEEDLIKDKDLLLAILFNHVVPGKAIKGNQCHNNQRLTTKDHKTIIVNIMDNKLYCKSEYEYYSYLIVKTDMNCCKSIVHLLDGVMVPQKKHEAPKKQKHEAPKKQKHEAPKKQKHEAPKKQECKTVWNTICSNPDLSTLKYIVEKVGLVSFLDNRELSITIFLPNNHAFKTLFAYLRVDVDSFCHSQKTLVVAIIKNHCVSGAVSYKDFGHNQKMKSFKNWWLVANKDNKGVNINSYGQNDRYRISKPDQQCCKSVAHVIDGVLVPKY